MNDELVDDGERVGAPVLVVCDVSLHVQRTLLLVVINGSFATRRLAGIVTWSVRQCVVIRGIVWLVAVQTIVCLREDLNARFITFGLVLREHRLLFLMQIMRSTRGAFDLVMFDVGVTIDYRMKVDFVLVKILRCAFDVVDVAVDADASLERLLVGDEAVYVRVINTYMKTTHHN